MLIPSRGPHPCPWSITGPRLGNHPPDDVVVNTGRMELRTVGPRALLAEVAGVGEALALALWAREAKLPVTDVVPGATTVLFDGIHDAESLRSSLARWTPESTAPERDEVTIPVTYDGADLDAVGEAWGTGPAGVVERHTGTAFVSAFCGFAPGFAYLAGLPEDLAVPRLDSPRTKVPGGSVGLAGSWCGIYPTASPGGWRILGRTDVKLWDATLSSPALLAPGTRVRFVVR